MISKQAITATNNLRSIFPFASARQAFGAVLKTLAIEHGEILLPAYIGWSSREGSGVFDPIAALDLDYCFYALDERMHIDLESLRTALLTGKIRVLVIIHYFGYVDPSYKEAVRMAREHGVFVVEDEAHALLSDVITGICGREGDVSIYSFHKMLPLESGGAAVVNHPESDWWHGLHPMPEARLVLSDYDLHTIATQRIANALTVDRLIRELAPLVEPLWGSPRDGEVPQTYPVLIRTCSRDHLYYAMNAAGFGVVSLYHTMIEQITPERYPHSHAISHCILNLPVHQDASPDDMKAMIRTLALLLEESRCIA